MLSMVLSTLLSITGPWRVTSRTRAKRLGAVLLEIYALPAIIGNDL
jgi:hypothetical protein